MSSAGKEAENVFDYFLVSGLSTKHPPIWIYDEQKKWASDHAKPALETVFKPNLLCRFPSNVVGNSWNTAVQGTLLQLCHPNGISITTKDLVNQPVFHSFPSTRDDGFRTYGHVLTYFELLSSNTTVNSIREQATIKGFSIPTEEIYAQKCICLISRHAYINTAESILTSLFKIFVSDKRDLKGSNLSIDSYIYNLLYEMPIPPVGSSLALNWNSTKPVIVQNPSNNELPLLDTHLSRLFSLLGSASNVLRLMTSAFLEHQILLVSKDSQNLTLVAEAITSLMFPFQWFHLYAPVLPFHLARNFLDAPVPYIMGIPLQSSEEKSTHITSEFDQCFVDLDRALVDCPEDQPSFPNHIKLREGLNAAYKKFKKNLEKPVHSEHILEESSLIVIEEEEDVEPSPPLHRRNAKKRLSKVHQEVSRVSTEHRERDVDSGGQSTSGMDVMDAAEELKNLHAVSTFSLLRTQSSLLESESKSIKVDEAEIQHQLFNVRVRETIFGTLTALLSQYDKFVILPDIDDSDIGKRWFLTRESQQNFDKSSFLSDQPERHLKFLSAFLETQAFASLVDNCILSQIDSTFKDVGWSLFDDRIKQAKSMPRVEKSQETPLKLNPAIDALSRSGTIISAGESIKNSIDKWIKSSENAVKRRFRNISDRYPKLRSLSSEETDGSEVPLESSKECLFPNILFPSLLQERMRDSEPKIYKATVVDLESAWHNTPMTKTKLSRQASISEFSPEMIAQTNWKFLEKLLKDVKAKTNKLVVRKMGQEAIALGHTESSIMGLEENTLIGSLCDLLERIWCHGLHSDQKKGKSALWSHLLRYEEDSFRIMRTPVHNIVTTGEGSHLVGLRGHAQSMSSLGSSTQLHQYERKSDELRSERRHSQPVVMESQYILPVPTDIISNIKRIRQLQEVKTNVGKCRAWIRLSLEQKQLQVHLKKLLLNRPLLQTMYKRYSLLRCDEEREQFLYHLLSLNAVDFTCFTNSFTKTAIPYRVWIYPKKSLSGVSQTSANVYVVISGELACTDKIAIPKNCTDFSFQHQNLGVLTTAILGHDNTGLLPKWLVDFVLVRNEVTGQAYYLTCKRWLGRSVDDGSTQRLLLAHTVSCGKDLNSFVNDFTSGKISIDSPSVVQKTSTVNDLRDFAGQAVNAIVKHFHPGTPRLCAGALTPLLCRPTGLVPVLAQIFQHGLKSTGMFRKQLFAWDAVSASCDCLSGKSTMVKQNQTLYKSTLSSLGDFIRNTSPQRHPVSGPSSGRSSPQPSGRDEDGFISQGRSLPSEVVVKRMLHYFNGIRDNQDKGLGKDDMFQLFVCFGLKEHLISDWIRCMSSVLQQGTLYDRNAFLYDQQAVIALSSLLDNLSEYSISYEPILLRGLEGLTYS